MRDVKRNWSDGLIELCLDHSEDQSAIEKKIADAFHLMYYNSRHTWNEGNTKWMGIPCFQNPLDMWIFQEVIFETKPTVIIECGSFMGGGSLFFAHMMDAVNITEHGIGSGVIVSIDTEDKSQARHSRIIKIRGRSTSSLTLDRLRAFIEDTDRIMVVLDSDHTTENVSNEMRIYAPMVSPGCYMVVMDSNLGGHPIDIPEIGPGPMLAIEQFMKTHDEFEIDKSKEKFYFTFAPSGWLRRKDVSEVRK
jgi:cephalosporin hydroxylase